LISNPESQIPHTIVGVAGGSGCGKTTILNRLRALADGVVTIIPLDAYYRDLSSLPVDERSRVNFDHPDSLDIKKLSSDLIRLSHNHAVQLPVYDFSTHTRVGEKNVSPTPIIIVEGTLVLSLPEVRERLDLKIFIDTPDDIRLLRRIQRDQAERGRDVASILQQYMETVRPMYWHYIDPCKHHADMVVDGMAAMDDTARRIWGWVCQKKTNR